MEESEEKLKSLLMKEESEKAGLKLNIKINKAVVHIHNGVLLSH